MYHDLADTGSGWNSIYTEIAEQLLSNDPTINKDLYFKTAELLMNSIYEGLGADSFSYADSRNSLASALRNNIYAFSLAKSFTQFEHYRDLMIGEDGKLLSKSSIIKKIADEGEIFNKRYLEAEIDNAQFSAIMAHKWDTLQSDFLQFSTVGDNRVRIEHKHFDKFTAAKSDPVWRRLYPPLAFGCRCTVIPGKEGKGSKLTPEQANRDVKPLVKDTTFDNNVGLSRVIYKDSHPYFVTAAGKMTNLSFENYGLNPWEKIKMGNLNPYKATSKQEYFDWWKKNVNYGQDDILVKSVLGDSILLTSHVGKSSKSFSFYKEHVLKKSEEKRHEYATEAINILKSPDEVWNNKKDGDVIVYLKFYDQGILKLVVDKNMSASSLYLLDENHSEQKYSSRKGILLYRK